MNSRTGVRLVIVLAFALAGCSSHSSDAGGRGTTAPSSSTSTKATATAADGQGAAVSEVCQTVNDAALGQSLTELEAMKKNGAALREAVAESYRTLGEDLYLTAPRAPGNFGRELTAWASASSAMARFIATEKPERGIVVEFGPAQKPFDAAQKSAEKTCGHKLPDLT